MDEKNSNPYQSPLETEPVPVADISLPDSKKPRNRLGEASICLAAYGAFLLVPLGLGNGLPAVMPFLTAPGLVMGLFALFNKPRTPAVIGVLFGMLGPAFWLMRALM